MQNSPTYMRYRWLRIRANEKGFPFHEPWLEYARFLKDIGEKPNGDYHLTLAYEAYGVVPGNVFWIDHYIPLRIIESLRKNPTHTLKCGCGKENEVNSYIHSKTCCRKKKLNETIHEITTKEARKLRAIHLREQAIAKLEEKPQKEKKAPKPSKFSMLLALGKGNVS
jgi:hypothetical protein